MESIALVLAAATLMIASFSLWQSVEAGNTLESRLAVPTPLPLPKINVIQLVNPVCADCWNAKSVMQTLPSLASVEARLVDFQTPEGQALIQQFNVTKAPTAIVTGQIDDARLRPFLSQGWTRRGDAYVFVAQEPVYFNPQTLEVTGRVELTRVVEPSCTSCVNLAPLTEQLKQAGIAIGSEQEFNARSPEGTRLIQRYNATTLPLLILSKDAQTYPRFLQAWQDVGSVEPDGALVWRQATPPYLNLTSNQTEGIVDLTELVDASCTSCYDVKTHQAILANFGVVIGNVTRWDVKTVQGRGLIEKYDVKQVPTVLLSPDAGLYDALTSIWTQVGSQEPDGAFVFRNMEALGNATAVNVTR